MQKYSLLTFVCCVLLLFTACKKETLLETNQDLSPKTNLTANPANPGIFKGTNSVSISEAMEAELDEADSLSLYSLLIKDFRTAQLDATTACFGPITGICGSPVVYSSCYYKYQIWNDPTNLYIDLYFPSSIIGTHSSCHYYVTPAIVLDLYDANGVKIGTVNVANTDITVTETRITFNINTLKSQYPGLTCVKLSGLFYIMKRCSSSTQCGGHSQSGSPQRVSTICITPRQFCLQQCQSECPTVKDITVDKIKLCGNGDVNGTVTITGDATKVATTWTVTGTEDSPLDASYNGNTVTITFDANTNCSLITRNIHAKSICTIDQSVLAERDFTVVINPVLSAEVSVDNFNCSASIDVNCLSDLTTIAWTLGGVAGTGKDVQLSSAAQTLNYTISNNGCSVNGSASDLFCLPLLKNNQTNSTK